jgi:hypothetical protein
MGKSEESQGSGTLGRIVELLRREPYLLYGLGSVLALGSLLGVGVATDETSLIVISGVLLLLAALVAAVLTARRRDATPRRATVRARDIRATDGGRVGSVATGDVPNVIARDIEASGGGSVASQGPIDRETKPE